jgi:hypothetical protein
MVTRWRLYLSSGEKRPEDENKTEDIHEYETTVESDKEAKHHKNGMFMYASKRHGTISRSRV